MSIGLSVQTTQSSNRHPGASPAVSASVALPWPKSGAFGPFGSYFRRAITARPLVVAAHVSLCVASSYLACWLRFDGAVPAAVTATYLQVLPWILVVRGLVFLLFGLYGGLWRYTSVWDLSRILFAVFTSTVIMYPLVYRGLSPAVFPRSLPILDAILLVCFLGGVRFLWRVVPSVIRSSQRRRVLVVGAGDAGEMIVREMQKGTSYQPVGFIDDDPSKLGRTIHGVEVLGKRTDLPRIVAATNPQEVLMAIPSAPSATVRDIVHMLEAFKLPITTLPAPAELVNGKVRVKQIRPLAIEDLLSRSQVALNTEPIRKMIKGKRVLVTGAGGSIGSELCRQIAALQPSDLVLYERYENSLYAIANDLVDSAVGASIHTVIGDTTDVARVDAVFGEYRPQFVFHAAAHKHVPLMEANPCEAVKNNVVGTQVVAEAARQHGVERFVLISTDKAVNPSSVMGASKRVAELIVQSLAEQEKHTRFVTVRFGNVLGSNGSVIPRMMDQIRAGGPVTVTHPDIRRYFMLIPEAVQLVLQAAVLADEGQTFVLDMGEQIKVLDVARNLIRLSGFVPDEEIPITFIGLRPGEKLIEELAGGRELLEPAGPEKVFNVRRTEELDGPQLMDQVATLVRVATLGQPRAVVEQLRWIVPTFNPDSHAAAAGGGAVQPARTRTSAARIATT
jgi:FlaA1/EpsC-like NDP-sugar epimerase